MQKGSGHEHLEIRPSRAESLIDGPWDNFSDA